MKTLIKFSLIIIILMITFSFMNVGRLKATDISDECNPECLNDTTWNYQKSGYIGSPFCPCTADIWYKWRCCNGIIQLVLYHILVIGEDCPSFNEQQAIHDIYYSILMWRYNNWLDTCPPPQQFNEDELIVLASAVQCWKTIGLGTPENPQDPQLTWAFVPCGGVGCCYQTVKVKPPHVTTVSGPDLVGDCSGNNMNYCLIYDEFTQTLYYVPLLETGFSRYPVISEGICNPVCTELTFGNRKNDEYSNNFYSLFYEYNFDSQNNILKLKINSNNSENCNFLIFDLSGEKISNISKTLTQGTNFYEFDFNEYKTGTYLFKIVNKDNISKTIKINIVK
jgi:hypothetical protein